MTSTLSPFPLPIKARANGEVMVVVPNGEIRKAFADWKRSKDGAPPPEHGGIAAVIILVARLFRGPHPGRHLVQRAAGRGGAGKRDDALRGGEDLALQVALRSRSEGGDWRREMQLQASLGVSLMFMR